MADVTKYYPQKLGRFNRNSCMTIYYSQPLGKGVFNAMNAAYYDSNYIVINFEIHDFIGFADNKYIFSSGIISGEVVGLDGTNLTVKVNKESFVTSDDFNNFLSKHSGINYDFEILKYYNSDNGNLKNTVINNILIDSKKRINDYKTYSEFDFVYSKNFYYTVKTKNIVIRDLSQIDDILRSSSFVIKSNDVSVINTGVLTNDPDVLGIDGHTKNIIDQPYFGGVQNNEWYRATLEESEFSWDLGRYKGSLTFKVKG